MFEDHVFTEPVTWPLHWKTVYENGVFRFIPMYSLVEDET